LKNFDELKSLIKGEVKEKEMMSKHTYYGIGGPAEAFIVPKDKEELSKILCYAHRYAIPAYFIGSGSNLLISDEGIRGIVLSPKKGFKQFQFRDSSLYAESGVMLSRIVKESIKRNLSGLESLIGVPGTLGGALVMNAGAFGGEISNYLRCVDIMDMKGQIISYNSGDLDFAYRFSSFKEDEFIISANFILENEDPKVILRNKENANKGRKTNQPLKFRSAGSVFKNPKNFAAGYLIDKAGLKGTKIGDAEISTHHANFFINHGKASSNDVLNLIRLARERVKEKFDIELELEIKLVGFEIKN
tara:strand:+ start:2444 stop:3352 length:909 start_codon:yes stop_codon:yes gene_type:complete